MVRKSDLVGQRRVAHPEFPNVGVGHGLGDALLDLADVAAELLAVSSLRSSTSLPTITRSPVSL